VDENTELSSRQEQTARGGDYLSKKEERERENKKEESNWLSRENVTKRADCFSSLSLSL